MNNRYFILLLCCIIVATGASAKPDGANKNFNSRFEYVTSFLDNITDYEEDRILSLNVFSEEDKTYKLMVIGIKELYGILYNEEYQSKEQLFFSVGKIFLRDTLFLSPQKETLLNNYIVDEQTLNRLNYLGFEKIKLKYFNGRGEFSPGIYQKLKMALKYYFDRRFYPSNDVHEIGDVVDFEYSFRKFNIVPILKNKQRYNQIWDNNGILIREELQQ